MTDKNSLMFEIQQLSRTDGRLTDGPEKDETQHKYSPIN